MLHRSCAGRHAGGAAAVAVASDERDPDYPVEAPSSQLWDKERERPVSAPVRFQLVLQRKAFVPAGGDHWSSCTP